MVADFPLLGFAQALQSVFIGAAVTSSAGAAGPRPPVVSNLHTSNMGRPLTYSNGGLGPETEKPGGPLATGRGPPRSKRFRGRTPKNTVTSRDGTTFASNPLMNETIRSSIHLRDGLVSMHGLSKEVAQRMIVHLAKLVQATVKEGGRVNIPKFMRCYTRVVPAKPGKRTSAGGKEGIVKANTERRIMFVKLSNTFVVKCA